VAQVKADIDRELNTEELRGLLDKQAREMAQLRQMLHETKTAVDTEQLSDRPAKPGSSRADKQEPPASHDLHG
jgi:hypothetical protein